MYSLRVCVGMGRPDDAPLTARGVLLSVIGHGNEIRYSYEFTDHSNEIRYSYEFHYGASH